MNKEIKDLKNKIEMWKGFNNPLLDKEIAEAEKRIKELEQQIEEPIAEEIAEEIIDEIINAEDIEILEVKIDKNEKVEKGKIKPPFSFDTTQNNVVIPTNYLIKCKDCDFRVMLGLSGISNCDDPTKEGNNSRYVTLQKVDRRMKGMCKTIGIDVSNFNKKVRTILKKGSDEFKIVERDGLSGTKVKCYQMDYEAGGFITIPVAKAERCLLTLGNNPIKLYCNLLWLCQSNGEFRKTHVPQSTLATLMGLSPRSENIVQASMQTLINEDLIEVWKTKEIVTTINKEGLPVSKPVEKYYYNIIIDNE